MEKEIKTFEDVFDYFGADIDNSLEANNQRLSRRVYKSTSCGAWAKVQREGDYERRSGKWTGRYVRCQGEWSLQEIKDENGIVHAQAPREVVEYFWPPIDHAELQKELERVLATDAMEASYTTPEEIEWSVKVGERNVFLVGSIVEGTDAETEVVRVYLPCDGKDLYDAIAAVEAEADYIWKSTHGCEECAKRNGWEWPGCAVDEECPTCGGDGEVI